MRPSRDFRLLWVAGLSAGLGAQITVVALPLTVLAATHSPVSAGLVATVTTACAMVAVVPAGAVADRFERQRLMTLSLIGSVLAAALLAALILTDAFALAPVIVLACVAALAGSVYGPSAAAFVISVVPPDQVGTAAARLQARNAAARLVGPLIGGGLYAIDAAVPFAAQAALLLLSLLCVLTIRTRAMPFVPDDGVRDATSSPSPMSWAGMVAGVRHVWQDRFVRVVLLVFGCGLNTAFAAAMFVAITRTADHDPSGRLTGVLTASAAAGSLLGGLSAARLPVQQHPRLVIVLACWGAAAAVLVLAALPAPATGFAFAAAMALAALGNVAFTTLLLTRTPHHLLGRVSSGAGALSMLTQPAGPLAGALLAQTLGASRAFLALGAVCLACAVVAQVATRGRNPRPTTEGQPSASAPSTSRA